LEPYRKIAKRLVVNPKVQIPGITTHITLDELQKIHAMYMARKLKEAVSTGKISTTLMPEAASNFSSSSSNGFTKSAATNLDSACVPDIKYDPSFNNAGAMSPTSGVGLESRAALFEDRALPTQRPSASYNFAQALF